MENVEMNEALRERFGKIVVNQCRDRGVFSLERLLSNRNSAPSARSMIVELAKLNPETQNLVKQVVLKSLDSAIHDFLFALYCDEKVQILVKGTDIREVSDGWHGDYFDWIEKFSEYPDPSPKNESHG
jgi:hypothetical protein